MGDAPVLFAWLGGEEAVVGQIADFAEFRVDGLLEAGFVADFVDEFVGADQYVGLAFGEAKAVNVA